MGGSDFTADQQAAWDAVTRAGEHFKGFDKYVFAVPMWNFGIPYALKHYIDVVTQPGLTFEVKDGSYSGLCSGPALLVNARGGEYNPNMPGGYDYEEPYMQLWCGFIGLTPQSILVQPTASGGPDAAKAAREAAIEKARDMAASF